MLIIPPGSRSGKHRQKRYEWEAGDLIYVPPNTIQQRFNADPERPARLTSVINREKATA